MSWLAGTGPGLYKQIVVGGEEENRGGEEEEKRGEVEEGRGSRGRKVGEGKEGRTAGVTLGSLCNTNVTRKEHPCKTNVTSLYTLREWKVNKFC